MVSRQGVSCLAMLHQCSIASLMRSFGHRRGKIEDDKHLVGDRGPPAQGVEALKCGGLLGISSVPGLRRGG